MNAVRPARLKDFVGQEKFRRILTILIGATKKRGEPVPHLLFSGPPGIGKTTGARIVANEMQGQLIEVVGSAVKNASDMKKHLLELQANDVLFIDEVHALPRRIEEMLYSAMEDRIVASTENGFDDLMRQIGIASNERTRTTHALPPFTLIGATTLLGLVSAPLRSRFSQVLQLEPYSKDELQTIVSAAASRLGFPLPDEITKEIAVRSRATARTAVGNLMWFRDFVMAEGEVPTMELLVQAFELKGIDSNGLTPTDRDYLAKLVASEEPIGLETLAAALEDSVETLESSIEPFLLREGYIKKTARGRVATPKAQALFPEVFV